MIRKTLNLCLGAVLCIAVCLSACSNDYENQKAIADGLNGIQDLNNVDAYSLLSKKFSDQQKTVWESDLLSEDRFTLNLVPTKAEKRIAKQFARTFQTHLSEGSIYVHYLLTELKKADLPVELVTIPLLESGLDTKAVSYSGAKGMWQYMRTTGKSLGLERSGGYDEIYDFVEATHASIKYLKYLYEELDHNWDLVAAAYNQGEFGVKKALSNAKRNGVKDINIYTVGIANTARGYVKRFHAFAELLRNPEAYGVNLPQIKNRPAFKRVEIAGKINSMKKASELSGVNLETLRTLNAGYLSDNLKNGSHHGLIVPMANVRKLESALQQYAVTGDATAKNETKTNQETKQAD